MINHKYSESFLKDFKKLKNRSEYQDIYTFVFTTLNNIKSLNEIPDLIKIRSFKNFYRIRFRNYRIGISIENDNITYLRILDRKDIYKFFP